VAKLITMISWSGTTDCQQKLPAE